MPGRSAEGAKESSTVAAGTQDRDFPICDGAKRGAAVTALVKEHTPADRVLRETGLVPEPLALGGPGPIP